MNKETRRDRCYEAGKAAAKLTPAQAAFAWSFLAEYVEAMGGLDIPKFADLMMGLRGATLMGGNRKEDKCASWGLTAEVKSSGPVTGVTRGPFDYETQRLAGKLTAAMGELEKLESRFRNSVLNPEAKAEILGMMQAIRRALEVSDYHDWKGLAAVLSGRIKAAHAVLDRIYKDCATAPTLQTRLSELFKALEIL